MIAFSCPTCGGKLRAPESAVGRSGTCKKCGSIFNIPNGSIETQAPLATVCKPSVDAQPIAQQQSIRNGLLAHLTNDEQDPAVVSQITAKVTPILMRGEELNYIAVQQRPVANFTRDAIVLTNKRFMVFYAKLFGRHEFCDYVWRDLHDCRIKEGITGATVSISAGNKNLSISYLPKKQAREVYRYAQEMEETAFAERRQRQLEETRAAAGGVIVQQGGLNSGTSDVGDPVIKLQQLKAMLDGGLITSDEYDRKKSQILTSL